MGEGPYISKQPESGVVGDSGGECPEQSVSQIEQCQKLGVSGARGDAGCRGEYTGCLLERAGMLGEYMVVPCECMSTEAGLDGTGSTWVRIGVSTIQQPGIEYGAIAAVVLGSSYGSGLTTQPAFSKLVLVVAVWDHIWSGHLPATGMSSTYRMTSTNPRKYSTRYLANMACAMDRLCFRTKGRDRRAYVLPPTTMRMLPRRPSGRRQL